MVVLTSGNIILDGTPKGVIDNFQGKIWKKLIEKSEVELAKEEFQVISTHISDGKVEIRVFAEAQPDADFIPVESNLEDVYFYIITKKMTADV